MRVSKNRTGNTWGRATTGWSRCTARGGVTTWGRRTTWG